MNLLTKTAVALATIALSANVAFAVKGTGTGKSPVTSSTETATDASRISDGMNGATQSTMMNVATGAAGSDASADTINENLDMADQIAGNDDAGSRQARVNIKHGLTGSESFAALAQSKLSNPAAIQAYAADSKQNFTAKVMGALNNAVNKVRTGINGLYVAAITAFSKEVSVACGA